MPNAQHSSKTPEWGTPATIIAMAREVMGGIDLDPATNLHWNEIVQAPYIYTRETNGLLGPWGGRVFVNPPGGITDERRSLAGVFWEKLMQERANISQAIFLAFSLEALATTQRSKHAIQDFPFCVPAKRLRFVAQDGRGAASPTHHNCVVYVPGSVDNTPKFVEVFRSIGRVSKWHP